MSKLVLKTDKCGKTTTLRPAAPGQHKGWQTLIGSGEWSIFRKRMMDTRRTGQMELI